jgi:hypothetical protein
MSSTFQNTTNITEQGRAVYNAHRDLDELKNRDKSFTSSGIIKLYVDQITDSTKSIVQGELVFSNKKAGKVNHKRKLTKISDLCVYSSFNGAFVEDKKIDKPENARKKKRKDIQFMGVSELTSNHKPGVQNDDEVVVQVGGTRTIVNNSQEPINVGDLVMWDLPSQQSHNTRQQYPGISRCKVLPETKVYKGEDMEALYLKNNRDGGADDFVKAVLDTRRRIIGKALSCGAPGRPFDILLGNHSV